MDKDYGCYLLGCRSAGVEPVAEWRFRLLQDAFFRHAAEAGQEPHGRQIPPLVVDRLAALVAEGYRIMAGGSGEQDEPGATACGVREPRVPSEPILAGFAARPLPTPDAPDQSFWRV